jgi:integrase
MTRLHITPHIGHIPLDKLTPQHCQEWLQVLQGKTERSARTLLLPPILVAKLQAHWQRQQEERIIQGMAWKEHGLVFPSSVGTPLSARNLLRHFKQTLQKAGLPDKRFHDLRHRCASLLLAQGVHPRVVMDILGHSQISVTMNTHGHISPKTQRSALDDMEDALGGGNDNE